ncbi:MAG: PP2C family protein-serine/threonine phosphatase [Candidatus Kapabacteria bacterium]|nr:PP2C family protein-serine/threonine phosphatase [Candidatus Kapabacteria bacterium]
MIEIFKNIFKNNKINTEVDGIVPVRKYQLTTIYILLIIALILKLTSDSLFYIIDQFDLNIAIIFRVFLSLSIIFFIGYLFFIHFTKTLDLKESNDNQKFIFDTLKVVLATSIIPLANIFLPKAPEEDFSPIPNLIVLFYIEIFSLFIIVTAFFTLSYLFKWLILRRHRKTKFQNTLILTSLFFIFITEILKTIFISKNDTTYTILNIIIGILFVFAFLLTFITSKKNNWIAVLPKRDKWKILGISIFGIIISIITIDLVNNENNFFINGIIIVYGANISILISLTMVIAYFLRISFATILTFPTSKIVEQRTYELNSLTYLNKLVANFTEFNKLIDTITLLAMKACNASGSWIEIYESDGNVSVASSKMIKPEIIKSLHIKPGIVEFFKSINETTIIESIPDKSIEYPELNLIDFAKSIIITPLFKGNHRIGSLIVFKLNEYDFEQEELLLMKAFGDNVTIALENSRLLEESLLKERYRQELLIAREIEQKLIPNTLPTIPNYSIAGYMNPAEEVGGDYYDVIRLANGNYCILLGDVSGKGMSAAFYMALLKGVVLGTAKESNSAKEIICKLNGILYENMEKTMFITLYAISIDNFSGDITLCRAGHMPALLKTNNSIKMLTPKGLGIGLVDSSIFDSLIEEKKIKLEKNDVCLLFSDGINELQNDSKEEFGFDRLIQSISKFDGNDSQELLGHINSELRIFAGNEAQKDDMTIFSIIFQGNS